MTAPNTLEDLLARWDDERAAGRDLPVDELCRDNPELAGRVAEEIQLVRKLDWLDRSFHETTGGRWVPPAEEVGAVLTGRYKLEQVLGRGGFGVVWLATEVPYQRPVALKLPHIRPTSRTRPQAGWKEYAFVESLHHPNIVPVYDVGVHDEKIYTVTRFVNGITLADALRRGPVEVSNAVRIVRDVATAVHFVHVSGIIHRDVKPANILLDLNGQALLTDFGVAVQAAPGTAVVPSTAAGTPAYQAPEQFRLNAAIDHRCDQYALGVVLFELLMGRRPFAGREVSETGARLIGRGRPAELTGDVEMSDQLNPIVQRCMAECPADRYASVADLVVALNQVLGRLDAARLAIPVKSEPEDPEPARGGWVAESIPARPQPGFRPGWLIRWLRPGGRARRRTNSELAATEETDATTRGWWVAVPPVAAVIAVVVLASVAQSISPHDPRLLVLIVLGCCLGVGLLSVGRWRVAFPFLLGAVVAVGVWVSQGPHVFWDRVPDKLGNPAGKK